MIALGETLNASVSHKNKSSADKPSYSDEVDVQVVVFLCTEYPIDNVFSRQFWISVRIPGAFSNPTGKRPWQTIELDVGISLEKNATLV